MNKLYKSLLLVGLSIPVFGATTTPISTTEKQLIDSKFAGVSTCIIDSSTGTNVVQCSSTTSGIILDIIASSVATTDSLVIRDSAPVAGGVSIGNTGFASNSGFIYVIDKNSLDKANRVFPRFKNGLEAQALVAPTAHLGNTLFPSWTIVYVKDLY